tara:strand:- start:64574 stop:64936 length:363 start_codon:yes stop_codon:yes gene_type:complete
MEIIISSGLLFLLVLYVLYIKFYKNWSQEKEDTKKEQLLSNQLKQYQDGIHIIKHNNQYYVEDTLKHSGYCNIIDPQRKKNGEHYIWGNEYIVKYCLIDTIEGAVELKEDYINQKLNQTK